MERITTWNRKHVLLADALYAVIISIFFTLMAGTNDSNPGIIAYFDHTVMAFWSFVLMVPVAMRRWKPQMLHCCSPVWWSSNWRSGRRWYMPT